MPRFCTSKPPRPFYRAPVDSSTRHPHLSDAALDILDAAERLLRHRRGVEPHLRVAAMAVIRTEVRRATARREITQEEAVYLLQQL